MWTTFPRSLDLDEARDLKDHQLITLLKSGEFRLAKWVSNYPPLLADIDTADRLRQAWHDFLPSPETLFLTQLPSHRFQFQTNPAKQRVLPNRLATSTSQYRQFQHLAPQPPPPATTITFKAMIVPGKVTLPLEVKA